MSPLQGKKMWIWPNFEYSGPPIHASRVKSGMQKWCSLSCQISGWSVYTFDIRSEKNCEFDHIWIWGGAPVASPFHHSGPNLAREGWTYGKLFVPNFIWISSSCHVTIERRKTWLYFQIQQFMVASHNVIETELNTGTQLRTLSYPTISKPFLNSNRLMKYHIHTLPLKSMMDKKHQLFCRPHHGVFSLSVCKAWASPYSSWWQRRSVSFCISLTFLDPMSDAENFWG